MSDEPTFTVSDLRALLADIAPDTPIELVDDYHETRGSIYSVSLIFLADGTATVEIR